MKPPPLMSSNANKNGKQTKRMGGKTSLYFLLFGFCMKSYISVRAKWCWYDLSTIPICPFSLYLDCPVLLRVMRLYSLGFVFKMTFELIFSIFVSFISNEILIHFFMSNIFTLNVIDIYWSTIIASLMPSMLFLSVSPKLDCFNRPWWWLCSCCFGASRNLKVRRVAYETCGLHGIFSSHFVWN